MLKVVITDFHSLLLLPHTDDRPTDPAFFVFVFVLNSFQCYCPGRPSSVCRVKLSTSFLFFVFVFNSRHLVSLSPEGVDLFSCSYSVCACMYNVENQIGICCYSSGLVVTRTIFMTLLQDCQFSTLQCFGVISNNVPFDRRIWI